MSKQSDVYERIVEALIDLEDVFVKPQDYRLTFIARNVKNPAAHVLVSGEEDDNRDSAIRQALDDLRANGQDVPRDSLFSSGNVST